MAKPTKHHGKWRIRWVDENGSRQSEVYSDFKTTNYELKKRENEVQEILQGNRSRILTSKTPGWSRLRGQPRFFKVIEVVCFFRASNLSNNFLYLKSEELKLKKLQESMLF